jgi:hypothetical protein
MLADEEQEPMQPMQGLVDVTKPHQLGKRDLPAHGRHGMERVWLFAIGSAVLGATLGWLAGDEMARRLPWKEHIQAAGENGRDRGEVRGLLELQNEAERKNAVVAMGFLSGILGMMLGAGGGLARKSNPLATLGGGTGLVLGAAVGTAVPWILVPVFYRSIRQPPNLTLPLMIHTCMYSAIGSIAGMALGIGLKGSAGAVKGFVAGAMGAALGSLVFNTVHTIAFPLEWDFSPMPGHTTSRMIAHLCVALMTVISVVSVLAGERLAATDQKARAGDRE